MYNISDFFGLSARGLFQPHLEFVDVKLNDDNRLFVDPRLIETSTDPVIIAMANCLRVYIGCLTPDIKLANRAKITYWLSGFKEPVETRLGFSVGNSNGNSIGEELKPKIETAIRESKILKTGIATHWSDLELFIRNISCDRISDMTTKITKQVLIKFTQDQCRLHGIPMTKVHQSDIFDPTTMRWISQEVELPVYFGDPIIFVPKTIVRRQKDASSSLGFFYRFAINNFVLNDAELLRNVPRNGKENAVLVKDLRSSITNMKDAAALWVFKFNRLLVDFRSQQIQNLKSLTDAEIMEIVYAKPSSQVA